jgi:flagellar hook-length control protein FliK
MNATPPVSQTPIAPDPAQQNTAAAPNSVNSGGNAPDFAAALSNAGPKPARKAAGAKAADGGAVGGQLPAAGNLSPPTTPPPAPPQTSPLTPGSPTEAAAAAITGTARGVSTPRAAVGTAAPAAAALAAKGLPPAAILGPPHKVADQNSGSAPADQPVAVPAAPGATSPAARFGLALGLPVDDAGGPGAPSGDRATTPTAIAAVPVTGVAAPAKGGATAAGAAASAARVGAAAPRDGASAPRAGASAARVGAAAPRIGASAPRAGASAGTATAIANKPATVTATPAINSAASGPTSTTDGSTTPPTSPSTNNGASANTDASAEAVTAAAMSAAATGGTGPGDAGIVQVADSSASPKDDSAAPVTGAKPPGAAAPNGPPIPAPAISVTRGAAAASMKAAAAAPVVTTLAGAGAADKRASGGTGDSLLSGTSVDAAGAAQLSVNSTAVADAAPTPPPTLKVAAGVDTPEFGQGLADRVSWMVDNNLNGAKLQVNPPQLGPIEVRIAVQGNHAQVWLASHSAVTRDALEASSPKLREMLGAQGFGQVSVDISQRSYQERSTYSSQPYESIPSASGSPPTPELQSISNSPARISIGAVDAYA